MFKPFPKMARLNRDIVITEKIDGTNAAVVILTTDEMALPENEVAPEFILAQQDGLTICAQSRTRLISPGKQDNYGFAGWVQQNADELLRLGPGRHFGEWWGQGIQRNYGLKEKRFSLFNVSRWTPENTPGCVSVVPTLHVGPFNTQDIKDTLQNLAELGSHAAPGYMNPEGIVIYHTAANQCFKVTVKNDEVPKGLVKE